jgi:hypothetical protein
MCYWMQVDIVRIFTQPTLHCDSSAEEQPASASPQPHSQLLLRIVIFHVHYISPVYRIIVVESVVDISSLMVYARIISASNLQAVHTCYQR